MANRITSYLRESRDELRKVVWPSRKKTVSDTVLVIAISAGVAMFLGVIDYALNFGIQRVMTR